MATDTTTSPLVILGLDAGDADCIERWAGEGFLPTIATLMQHGCWGRLTGPDMVSEHGIWVSLFSGVSRGQHGYYHWRPLVPGTYELQLSDLREVSALPFWAHLQGRDKKVAIIDAPEIYPVAGLPGVQLANWAPHNPRFATCAEPPGLLQELCQRFEPQLWVEEKVGSSLAEDLQIHRGVLERIANKGALCRDLLRRERFDLVVMAFFEPHIAGHQFWDYSPEASRYRERAAAAAGKLTHAIRDVYQAIDQQLGLLLAEVPDTPNVFVVSNMGMQEDYPHRGLTEAFCRQLGYCVPTDSSGPALRPLAVARRVIPDAWRLALSRYLSRNTRERLLADQFRSGSNWHQTTAFAIPSFYMGFLRVNLRGREPEGIVAPGAEYIALLDRIEADLRQLVDPETGQPAVQRIVRTVDVFGSEALAVLPDVFFEWQPTSHFKRCVVHPRATLVQEHGEFFRSTRHTNNGFVAAAGPRIYGRGAIGDVSLLDLAPTLLALLGEPVPQSLSGHAIAAMLHG